MTADTRLSALVVCYNEAHHLPGCLQSLSFCDEVILVDLGSVDGSEQIGRTMGVRVLEHAWKPYVEAVWPDVVPKASNDWILRLDPDEMVPEELASTIRSTLASVDESVAGLSLPHLFHFRGRPLHFGPWGGTQYVMRVFHRSRVRLQDVVHRGIVERGEVIQVSVPAGAEVQHYWVDSWRQLFDKHLRYLRVEGESRYAAGEHFSIRATVREAVRWLRFGFVGRSGWRGGPTVWALCLFRVLYEIGASLALRTVERERERTMDSPY